MEGARQRGRNLPLTAGALCCGGVSVTDGDCVGSAGGVQDLGPRSCTGKRGVQLVDPGVNLGGAMLRVLLTGILAEGCNLGVHGDRARQWLSWEPLDRALGCCFKG